MYVRSHTNTTVRFSSLAKEKDGNGASTLLLDVPTRWNSTFELLSRVLHFDDVLLEMYNDHTLNIPLECIFSREEFDTASAVLEVLSIFRHFSLLVQENTRFC